MPEPPFVNKEEYRQHIEKEASINKWCQYILKVIDSRWREGNEVYEAWEGDRSNSGKLLINYTQGREDEQTWIPVACLWSEDWENLNKEAKEEAKRQWKEREEKRLFEQATVEEADERAWLARLQKKYPGAVVK